jgi:hypothetical protein
LKAGVWFRRGRLLMVSPVRGDYRRRQAEIPLIVLCRFPGPALCQHCNRLITFDTSSEDRNIRRALMSAKEVRMVLEARPKDERVAQG